MSRITYVPDVADQLVDLLPHHMRGPQTVAFVRSLGNRFQQYEDLYEHLRGISLTGVEYLLDLIGGWVGVDRRNNTDSDFRARILAQIVLLHSGGQREDILDILRIIRGDNIRIWQLGGGWLQVNYQIDTQPVVNEHQAAQILDLVLNPGAVLLSSYTDRAFGFAGPSDSYGFGEGELGIAADISKGGIIL